MENTSLAPENFKVLLGWGESEIWIDEAKCVADTVNAFVSCYTRAVYEGDSTAAKTWADTILYFHPKSIVGYYLRASYYDAMGDSIKQLAAIDSVIKFCENYEDSALPDSAGMNHYQRLWLEDMLKGAEWTKYYVQNPPKNGIGIR